MLLTRPEAPMPIGIGFATLAWKGRRLANEVGQASHQSRSVDVVRSRRYPDRRGARVDRFTEVAVPVVAAANRDGQLRRQPEIQCRVRSPPTPRSGLLGNGRFARPCGGLRYLFCGGCCSRNAPNLSSHQ